MADLKISALTASTTPLAGTEVLPIVQSSTTKQVSVANLTAGRAISATQLTLTTGNLIVASGQGVDFSATPGTGTSELLADYEEGTWTPTIASQTGALTSYSSIGYYTKVGNTITVFGSFLITSVGTAGGKALISNLPFTSLNLPAGPDVIGTGVVREYNATGLTYFVNINDNATTGNICTSLNGAIVWLDTYGYLFSVTYQTA
jgi:hypothetical protein